MMNTIHTGLKKGKYIKQLGIMKQLITTKESSVLSTIVNDKIELIKQT